MLDPVLDTSESKQVQQSVHEGSPQLPLPKDGRTIIHTQDSVLLATFSQTLKIMATSSEQVFAAVLFQ